MRMPPIFDKGRRRGLVLIAALALLQGAAAGGAAFATRILFGGLHQGAPISLLALAMIAGAGIVIAGRAHQLRRNRRPAGPSLCVRYPQARCSLMQPGLRPSDVEARRAGYISLRFVGDMTAFKSWLGFGSAAHDRRPDPASNTDPGHRSA